MVQGVTNEMARLAVATTARSRRNRVVGLAWPLHGVDAMTMDEFWALIEVARSNHDTYLQRLKALSQEALVDLYWTYEETAAELRGDRHVRSFPKGTSHDAMVDFGGWVVSEGRQVYEDLLKHPAKVRSHKCGTMMFVADVTAEYKARYKTYVPLRPD